MSVKQAVESCMNEENGKMNYKVKDKVQGFDNDQKQWLNATIIQIKGKKFKLRWASSGSECDCWTQKIRVPVGERTLQLRNVVTREKFRVRGHPRNLQGGDVIYDNVRRKTFVVKENDPFAAEVSLI